MGSLPKPLIGLLLGTVAFFAIWMVALKPSSSSSSGGSQGGVGQYQSAINQAHGAVTTSNQANAKLGAPTATTGATTPAPTSATTKAPTPAKTAAKPTTTPATKPAATKPAATKPAATKPAAAKPTAQSESAQAAGSAKTVETAVRAGKVVAVLFYNGAAADDRAMKSELAAIPTHHGQVVKVAVPVSQLIQFSALTQSVDVNTAPELVLIDRARQASTLIGYADGVEIAQRIDDALAAK
jgi:hypothetical protein